MIDSTATVLRTMVRGGSVVACFYFLHLAIESLAGKDTTFRTFANWALNAQVDRGAAYVVAIVSGAAWWRERRLRRNAIREKADYIESLEKRVDPGRSSSKLQVDGAPRKEDLDAAK